MLEKEKAALKEENSKLHEELSRYKIPVKTSQNSNAPPSKENLKAQAERRTRSLRTSSGRPSGGQKGHKGVTVEMSKTPDKIEFHAPGFCTECGRSLSDILGKQTETRQSIDIPLPICPIVTNHVMVEKKCICGKCSSGVFPTYVKPGVSYGVNIHAVVAYLSTVQHIPFKRLTDILNDAYGVKISQGTIANILNRMRKQSSSAYETIRQIIEKSPVVGADETGSHVNAELHWIWVFQNTMATYIYHDKSRGKAAIDKDFPDGLPKSVLVTDRHSSYFNMNTIGHQICLVHILRDLIYLGELDKKQKGSPSLLDLLRESIHQWKVSPPDQIDLKDIKKRFDDLMEQDVGKLDDKFNALQKA